MRVLLVVHGLPPVACGGTETYVDGLAQALARQPGMTVAVLAREGDHHRPELAVRRERRGAVEVHWINNTFQMCESFEASYRNPALRRAAAALLDDIAPDVVHVHHLTCLSTELLDEFAARAVPVIVTLNDYWIICHRGQLLDDGGNRCDGPGDQGCARCIPAAALAPSGAWRVGRRMRGLRLPLLPAAAGVLERAVLATGSAARRRAASASRAAHMRDVCRHVDLFLAPSRTLESRHLAFGLPAERMRLIDQGIDVSGTPSSRAADPPPRPLRLGFAGSLMLSKAPHVLLDAVAELPSGAATVDLIGALTAYHSDTRYADATARRLGAPWIRRLGPVPHDRMPAALAQLDLLVVPSIWIENAPFVIREAFAAGVPVVASRLGGMAEMVRDGVDGLLFEPGDAGSLATQLRRVIEEPALLASLRANIRRPMSMDEDAGQLGRMYASRAGAAPKRRAVRNSPPGLAVPPDGAPSADPVTAIVLNYRTPDATWLTVRSIQASQGAAPRIIVVDNGSGDGSESALRARLPGVDIVQAGANLGFSGGCNVGIRRALASGAAAVLLVNSDVVLPPDAIARLVQVLEHDPRIGIASPVILSAGEPDVIASAGMTFAERTGRMRHRAAGRRMSSLGGAAVSPIDAVSGCAMIVRRAVFERVGLLDVPYFYSFEDLEFCLRAASAGFLTVCVTDAVAYHEGASTIGARSPRRVYYGVRNHLRVAQQVAPLRFVPRAARGATIVALNLAYAALSPEVPLFAGLASVGRGTIDHLRGRYGA